MLPQTPPPIKADITPTTSEIGFVTAVKDYIIWINGLPNIRINEIVVNDNKNKGLVISIKESLAQVLVLDDAKIKPHERFYRTGKQLAVPAGENLLGRAIDPLGQPIDGRGAVSVNKEQIDLEQPLSGIKDREFITRQFETGITLVDMLVPIAYGQRELIIGDSHSGKTSFLLDTIINQKDKGVVCIFAMVGKSVNEIRNTQEILKVNAAQVYTVIIGAASSEPAPLVYLAPIVAISLAQYFQKKGKDVLLILDDLGVHGKFYREISLLSGKPPGRQSYPGDIFYQHAKLVERAGCFNKEAGGGSITALPVIETNLDDFASYMTTNLMGMTDGHLMFSAQSYRQGIKPSIDVSLSVSRVGRQTQTIIQKQLADRLKALLAEAKKLETFARLGSDVSAETQAILKKAEMVKVLLNQVNLDRSPLTVQLIMMGLIFTPFLGQRDAKFLEVNKPIIKDYLINKFDLVKFSKDIAQFKTDEEFIQGLQLLTPTLEKLIH
jgi:F-type H+/Na+-transporting ATPase subunit alpha